MSSKDELPADLDYEWPAPDLTDEEWGEFVSRAWCEEWEDPREDIYTLNDGKPVEELG
jgi:hypothetical protein